MADTDNASYIIRYNLTDNNLEYFQGADWYSATMDITSGITQLHGDVTAGPGTGNQVATLSPTAAVKSLHADSHTNLTGNVQLVSGSNITLTQVGQAITVASSSAPVSPNFVQFTTQNTVTTTSTTPTSTGLILTITPSSSSAAIHVIATFELGIGSSAKNGYATILFDGTPIIAGALGIVESDTAPINSTVSIQFLHTPGDTSAHTYNAAIYNADGATTVTFNASGNTAVITAVEVH